MHRRQAPHPCMVTSAGVPSWTPPCSLCCGNALSEGEAGGLRVGRAKAPHALPPPRLSENQNAAARAPCCWAFFPAVLDASPCGAKCGCTGVGHTGARRVPTRSERWPRSRVGHAHLSCAAVPSAVRCCCPLPKGTRHSFLTPRHHHRRLIGQLPKGNSPAQ